MAADITELIEMTDTFAKIALGAVYLFVFFARLVRAALGSDPLQLNRPISATSYWLVRDAEPSGLSYFSEASVVEGRPTLRDGTGQKLNHGTAWLLTPLLRAIGRLYAPPHELDMEKYRAGADREEGIPDEVYTLW